MDWKTFERVVIVFLVLLFLFLTKKFILEIIEKVMDVFKYFISEKQGSAVQKLNAALGYALFLVIVGSFGGLLYRIIANDIISNTLLVLLISCLLFFVPVLIFCERFTRHRYRRS